MRCRSPDSRIAVPCPSDRNALRNPPRQHVPTVTNKVEKRKKTPILTKKLNQIWDDCSKKILFCPPASALRDSWRSQPTIAHLQIAQASPQPKFAKELSFLRSFETVEKLVEKIEHEF